MSADNWRECMACKRAFDKGIATKRANVGKQYGKIPAPDYMLAVQAIDGIEAAGVGEDTLREDYENWIDELGVLQFRYSCSCSRCGFDFSTKWEMSTGIASFEADSPAPKRRRAQ